MVIFSHNGGSVSTKAVKYIQRNQLFKLSILLKKCKQDPNNIMLPLGDRMLHVINYAIEKQHVGLIRYIVRSEKFSPEICNSKGGTPLFVAYKSATRNGRFANKEASLELIFKILSQQPGINFRVRDLDGVELLSYTGYTPREAPKKREVLSDMDCVVCLDGLKQYMITPCNHICLCRECANNPDIVKQEKCPKCTENKKDIVRVYH